MSVAPVYLSIRSRQVLRHAAELLADEASALKECNSVDGVILEIEVKREYDDLVGTAKSLRQIARERVNKEPKT